MANSRSPLRLNVGFILHEEVGYKYEFSFDMPEARVAEDLSLRDLRGLLTVGRTPQGLLFTGGFSGATELNCVRCLKPFDKDLAWEMMELYALSDKSASDSGLVVPEDARIDLQPLIREYALLEVPINPLCRPDCRGLCPICGEDLNLRDCGHRPDAGESSFTALKDFFQP